jgi:hypothetical protein
MTSCDDYGGTEFSNPPLLKNVERNCMNSGT